MISALMELMNHAYQNGDYTQLAAAARTLLDAVPDDIVSAQLLAVAYLKTGRGGEAAGLIGRLRSRLPGGLRWRRPAGPLQPAQAVCLREATERNPDYADTWCGIAAEWERLDRLPEAIAMLRLALATRPGDEETLRGLGRLGLDAGDADAAEEGYRGLLAVHADDVEAVHGLQRVLDLRLALRDAAARVSSAASTADAENTTWQASTNSRPVTSTGATSPSATTPAGSC